ncbi:SNF2 helicase associated domain-containing protein [Paenibacillus thailandensis]|uniref:SNF2 helicase associated domain-containing protein n=1 Tax=Paenibacillus thailandensis TaxID=393250 RepID=A0ABW5QTT0_9BACL
MSFQLTRRVIKLLCGPEAFAQGEADLREGRVRITAEDAEAQSYEAAIGEGRRHYIAKAHIDGNGDVEAGCSCLFAPGKESYCRHIAALLLNIHELSNGGQAPVRSYSPLLAAAEPAGLVERRAPLPPQADEGAAGAAADRMLKLFSYKPQRRTGQGELFETRTALDVEFTCAPVDCGIGKQMLGISMRLGPKRLYVVQRIHDLLPHIDARKPYTFSKHFTYEPELHCFRAEDDAVIQALIRVQRNEELYREAGAMRRSGSIGGLNDRTLLLPPESWARLQPLLEAAPNVKLEHDRESNDGLHVVNGPLPLRFEFDNSRAAGYSLRIEGLAGVTVLEEYGMAMLEGKLVRLPREECGRLAGLQRLLERQEEPLIPIRQEQMEPFMDKVVPGLMKLGKVRIAQDVQDRIVHKPFKAKLYLDRVRDRLLASLEFHYGELVINPLDPVKPHNSNQIVMRDGDAERRILQLMDQVSFAKTEGGYFMSEEDEEYRFLYHVLPELEKLAQIYATSAVKLRIFTGGTPILKADTDERTDWLEFKFSMDGIPESEIRKLLQSLEEKRTYHRLPDGALLPLETEEMRTIIRVMNELGIVKRDLHDEGFRVPVLRGLSLMETGDGDKTLKLGRSFRQLLANLRNPDNLDFRLPDSLAPVLRDYQKDGFYWMKTLAHYRFGGILADDMGLGKTVQAIAFLASVVSEIREHRQPALVVAPASLLYNWSREFARFAPELKAVVADGTAEERAAAWERMDEADVVITSYPLLRRDIERYSERGFHTLFLDEAQYIKNYATQTARAVKRLQAKYRFALTGTPVENRLEELWSIFGAVFPALFPKRDAFNDLPRDIVARRSRPFLLRRVKGDVLRELPDKIESVRSSDLLPEQRKLYAAYLAKLKHETLKHLDEDTFDKNKIRILAGITRLRQICCHPGLFVEDYGGSSAKFEQLLELIEECLAAGRRMIVFSQFTKMLGLISRTLAEREQSFFYLDGSTPPAERVELCARFNEGERDLFLASTKAGGTGLNLTGADTVILYDLWWNPAVEQQAADRAHRIGQNKAVHVIRLVSQGTVEDKMIELQERKKNLVEEVIKPGREELENWTERDILELLQI